MELGELIILEDVMIEEKRKKLDRIKRSLEVVKSTMRNNMPVMADQTMIEEMEWLMSEVTTSWDDYITVKARCDELLSKEIERLQKIEDFERGC